MAKFDRIEVNPKILVEEPVINGTRIPVALILNLLARSYTVRRILEAYPNLKRARCARCDPLCLETHHDGQNAYTFN